MQFVSVESKGYIYVKKRFFNPHPKLGNESKIS